MVHLEKRKKMKRDLIVFPLLSQMGYELLEVRALKMEKKTERESMRSESQNALVVVPERRR